MKTASHFAKLDSGRVQCELCPHHCVLNDQQRGVCLTRQNIDGELASLNYCRPISTAIDPVEKKPLYHFHPGKRIFSTGPNGCTFKCSFCQNCEISQEILPTREVPAAQIAQTIINSKTIGVAYTYSEPYIWFETIMEVGRMVSEAGKVNVMVTNGYMEPGPLDELLEVVSAMNIDIKSMRPEFYKKLCKGQLEPVLRTCETVKKRAHLEVTNLLITGENDSESDIQKLADFVARNLGKDTPLHLSGYFPRHKMHNAATTQESLLTAWEIARNSLDYVYVGNISAGDKANTYCPACDVLLVERMGYSTHKTKNLIADEHGQPTCRACGQPISIVC